MTGDPERLVEHLDGCGVARRHDERDSLGHLRCQFLRDVFHARQSVTLALRREIGGERLRAEAQVRDRTKSRFSVPGAWREENLEPKATLRSIIAEGRLERFRQHYLERRNARFAQGLQERLEEAHSQGRLQPGRTACSDDQTHGKAA